MKCNEKGMKMDGNCANKKQTIDSIGKKRKYLAQYGEELAAVYLMKKGYYIIGKNFSCPLGEIDLVARDGNTMVFIEVKSRHSTRYGFPQEAVTRFKKERICRVANWFLKENSFINVSVRFDVVTVFLDSLKPHVSVIKGAFDADGL